ncbi:MAG: methylenetetrahydrofolate reductase C-terminal domain-containing protein [Candidatus Latescibacterota bacterium]|jgi:methylenetetrahydrofolate reductase (NADPH)
MALIRIGESLHCHIPSVQKSARRWLCGDSLDRIAGERHLIKLVNDQVAAGANYLDVNVDNFLTETGIGREGGQQVLSHVLELIIRHAKGIPPCVDSSDPEMLIWGLRRYQELTRGRTRPPLINSVAISRLEPLTLRREFPFSAIGMLLEQAGDSSAGFTDIAGPEAYHETARAIFAKAREAGFAPGEIFFDPTVGPLGADMVGYTRRTFEGIRSIRQDPEMAGVHICLGLSNCSDGLPRRLAINRAYLRVAMEYGVDAAILDAPQVSGDDLCDPRLLQLIHQVVESEAGDTLMLLVDYAQAHPRTHSRPHRAGLPDQFGQALADPAQKVYILEMAPSEAGVEQIFAMAEAARSTPFTFTVTDTPGGNRIPGPDTIGLEVGRIMDRQPIVNLSCKSDDRNGLIQRVLGLYHQGLRHLFAVTGDYAPEGRIVFDLDAVTLLWAIECLKRGLEYPGMLPRAGGPLEGLTTGAAVSPFKYLEADLWGQYLKVWKKRQVGASYFITQLGYDVRKFQELKLFTARAGMAGVPLIGSVYLVTPQFLNVLNRVHVAGVVIPEELKQKYRGRLLPAAERKRLKEASFVELAEQQRALSFRRAALLVDVLLRGLDYKGVDLAGFASVEDALEVLELSRELGRQDWRASLEEYLDADGKRPMVMAPESAFYLFPEGPDGLLTNGPFQRADRRGYPRENGRMRWLHQTFFDAGGWGHGLVRWATTGKEDGALLHCATLFEQATKSHSLGCEMCGDCRIPYLHYLCPEPSRGCGKRLVNGPCGGADAAGMCEVYPERRCFWGQVIERALADDALRGLTALHPPKDPRLQHTSSWRNEFLGRCPQPLAVGDPGDALPR